jgi:diketogulonate reductase-like aldo/keto reductase
MHRVVSANGATIPAIGLGTGRLRGDVAIAAVVAALDHGYRHIDTAAKYGNEVEVGEAIRGHAIPRSEIFVTTKVMPARGANGGVELAVEASLGRLRLDQVDLVLLHWPDQQVSLRYQVEALCNVRARGLARHIGVSNFPVRYLEAAVGVAAEPIVVNQVESHPYFPHWALSAACARHGIATSAFCPLGRGALMEEPVVQEIAAAHGKSPAQIVLRWHMEQPLRLVVPSSSNRQRIGDNIAIFDFALMPAERERIDLLARDDGRVVRGAAGYDWHGAPA